MSLFSRKPLDALIAEGSDQHSALKKALTATDFISLSIGAIIGAGIFAVLRAPLPAITGI